MTRRLGARLSPVGPVLLHWGVPALLDHRPSEGRQIVSLDGLRGVAVLFVLLSHLSNAGIGVLPFLSFSGIGKVGVWLFFVLSSFLLTSQFLEKSDEQLRQPAVWFTYWVRRFLRIYPLFGLVMLVAYLVNDQGIFPPLGAPENLDDLVNRLTIRDAKGIEWSILVEFRFYFILPLIVIGIVFLLRRKVTFVMLVLLAAVVLATLYGPPPSLIQLRPYLPIFLLGISAAVVHVKIKQSGMEIPHRLRVGAEALAITLFVVVVLLTPSIYGFIVGKSVPLNHFHKDLTLFGALWSAFLLAHLNGTGHSARVLSAWPLRYLGVISFGVYLWHPPIIKVVSDIHGMAPPLAALLVLVIVTSLATLTYVVVERPFLRMRPRPPNWLPRAKVVKG